MSKNALEYIAIFIVLILAQVLIFNHILLFDVALPIVFIYVLIRLPMNLSRNWLLTIAFLSGLIVDVFSDTPGINAMACTILAMVKRPALFAYIPRDDRTKVIEPSLSSLGIGVYSKFLLTMVTIYSLLVFSIEYFSLFDVKEVVIMSAASSALSFILLLGVDSLVFSSKN